MCTDRYMYMHYSYIHCTNGWGTTSAYMCTCTQQNIIYTHVHVQIYVYIKIQGGVMGSDKPVKLVSSHINREYIHSNLITPPNYTCMYMYMYNVLNHHCTRTCTCSSTRTWAPHHSPCTSCLRWLQVHGSSESPRRESSGTSGLPCEPDQSQGSTVVTGATKSITDTHVYTL